MSRNILNVVVSALVVVVFAYEFYQDRQKTSGIEINVGKSGIFIGQK
jgi:hypothetical protein